MKPDVESLTAKECYARVFSWLKENAPAVVPDADFVTALPTPKDASQGDIDFVLGEVIYGRLENYCMMADATGTSLMDYARSGLKQEYDDWVVNRKFQLSKKNSSLFEAFGPRNVTHRPRLVDKFAYPARKHDKWGYIDQDGHEITPFNFLAADGFSDGLACVNTPKGLGYVDLSGNVVILDDAHRFDYIFPFHEGRAEVSFVSRPKGSTVNFGFIDRTGKTVVDELANTHHFSDGRALVWRLKSPGMEYIDRSGHTALAGPYGIADSFSEGLAKASNGGTLKYIDINGEVVIDIFALSGGAFHESLADVLVHEGVGFIDRSGTLVIDDPTNSLVRSFHEGLAAVKRGDNWGFINHTGELEFEETFDDVGHFSNGLAVVSKENKRGYVNRRGDCVIPPSFDKAASFVGPLAQVWKGDVLSYVNRQGEVVWAP